MFNFDARTVQPWVGFELVPAGWAKVAIRKSNLKPNQAQNGDFLELQYEILEGPAKGKVVFDRFNMRNPSVEAVEIGYRKLASVCYCTGVLTISAQQQPDFVAGPLHGIPFFVEIGVQKSQRGTDMNVVTAYKDINGADPGKQGQPQGGVMPSAPPPPPTMAPPAPPQAPPAPTQVPYGAAAPAPQQVPQPQGAWPQPGQPQQSYAPPQQAPAPAAAQQPVAAPPPVSAPAAPFPGGPGPAPQQWQAPQGVPAAPAAQPGAAPSWAQPPGQPPQQ